MPRLYREAPLNSIWEGSGNVICLDILRALDREPACREALMHEFLQTKGMDLRLDAFLLNVEAQLTQAGRSANGEAQARRLAERLALGLQAGLMIRHGSSAIAEGFLTSRLRSDHGYTFGTLPAGVDVNL
jgi:putative acyl-CoA dehydrogenase